MSAGRIVLAVLILLGAAWAAERWLIVPETELMAAPSRHGQMALPPPSEAYIGVPVVIDAASLSRFASNQAPRRAGIPGQRIWQEPSKDIINRATGRRHTVPGAAMYGNGEIVRIAPVAVRTEGRSLVANATLDVRYAASMNRLRGSARASLEVSALIDYGIGPDWRPTFSVQPDYRWLNPPSSRFFGTANVSYEAQARSIVEARIRDLEHALPARTASTLPVETLVRALWEIGSLPVPLSPNTPLRLSIQPKRAYFLAPRAHDGGVLLDIGIAGETMLVDATAPSAIADLLPPPDTQPPEQRKLQFPMPVRLDYDTLAAQLHAAFTATPIRLGNGGSMTVREVKLYPAAPDVVLALRVETDLPGRWLWFNPRGWIYFTAQPNYDGNLRNLTLQDFRFEPATDMDTALAQALAGTGLDDLAMRAKIPLSETISQSLRDTERWLDIGVEGALLGTLQARHPAMRGTISRLDVQGDLKLARGAVTLGAADDALWLFHPVSGDAAIAVSLGPP